jgi:phospholipid/cholesterol/gamma-HCH transport system substrate-binding protein
MKEKRHELIVGIVVTCGVLLFVLGIVWGRKTDIFSNSKHIRARFDDIRGVEKGDAVMIRGMQQGEVERVVLGPDYIELTLRIKDGIPVYSDSRAIVEDRDLMGGKQVRLEPGQGPDLLKDGDFLQGRATLAIGDVLSSGNRLIEGIDSIIVRLGAVTDPKRMDAVMKNVEGATATTRNILDDNRLIIRSTLMQIESITQRLKEDSTAVRAGKSITRLDSCLSVVYRLVREVEREDGSLKLLVRDRALYDHLVKTSADLDSLVADVKAHPNKYIHVSVF